MLQRLLGLHEAKGSRRWVETGLLGKKWAANGALRTLVSSSVPIRLDDATHTNFECMSLTLYTLNSARSDFDSCGSYVDEGGLIRLVGAWAYARKSGVVARS